MRFVRVMIPNTETPVYGVLEGTQVALFRGLPWGDPEFVGVAVELDELKVLAPTIPSKIICVGKNYAEHAAEMNSSVPDEPVIFLKPNTTVIGDEDSIVLPDQSDEVHYEAELAVVIGAVAKDVPVERAGEVIFGYTCANDVTARDLQAKDKQWTRAKSFDTFCPLGPWIETELDPATLAISCEVNDEVKQSSNTKEMIRGVHEMVSWISQIMTLIPGDVILTGTPAGVGPIVAGDSVSVTIQGIGTLTNPVVARS
ncbi:MAG: FAA hydrolase family protein [Actinobacteria bacterium]|jgi:2-keto-4-pentenoate hydratase/2-oxohepta-3-ene-1,7-dioic acid hydratase in catechol pathway|nr:FAA hydrolase family protein [Actinomycetota bacterium]